MWQLGICGDIPAPDLTDAPLVPPQPMSHSSAGSSGSNGVQRREQPQQGSGSVLVEPGLSLHDLLSVDVVHQNHVQQPRGLDLSSSSINLTPGGVVSGASDVLDDARASGEDEAQAQQHRADNTATVHDSLRRWLDWGGFPELSPAALEQVLRELGFDGGWAGLAQLDRARRQWTSASSAAAPCPRGRLGGGYVDDAASQHPFMVGLVGLGVVQPSRMLKFCALLRSTRFD